MNNPLSIRNLLSGLILSLAALFPCRAAAQELNCQVEINSDQMQGTNKSVFESLQQAVNDYLNTTHFTNMQFNANERIDCRFFLTVKEYADNVLKGDLQIQSSRPTYNASYTTTLLNFKDTRIEFQYQEGEPLVFSTTSMESQLTAILNFYAYLIIALDGDSMAPRGGEEQWEQLKMIVQFAQSAGEPGWKAFEDKRNRSAVLGAFTDPATNAVRDMLYKYHRQGLDEMALSPDKGRAQITESLSTLQKVYDHDPMSVFLAMFMDSKLDELVNIYTKASQTERDKVVEILQPLYPTEMKRINFIKQGVNK